MCSCTVDYKERIYDLARLYWDDYEILRYSEDSTSKDNHYLLLRKDDTIYLDKVERRPSLKKILPNENGVELKTAEIAFNNKGATILNRSISNKHDYLSAPYIYYGDYCSYITYYRVWREDKDLLYLRNEDFSLLYRVGNKEAFVLYGDAAVFDTNCIRHTERFTFADLFDNDDYSEFFSLADYPFYIEKKFSYKDLSFIGFSDIKIKREGFPLKPFIKAAYDESFIVGYDENYIYLPIASIGTRLMDIAKEAIDANIIQLEEALREEKQRAWLAEQEAARQREEQEMIKYIEDNAVDFNDMRSDYSNPMKAEKKYTEGMDIILKIKLDKIGYSYSGYTYVMPWSGNLVDEAYVYSDDNSFAELDYPQIVWIKAKYTSRYKSVFGETTYKFTDAQLLLWKKPGLLE